MTGPTTAFARSLAFLLTALLVAPLVGLVGSADVPPGRTPRGPILIHGDDDLCDPLLGGTLSGVRNCDTADGTAENPFVISQWQVFGRGHAGGSLGDPVVTTARWAIEILETTAHILVQDNEVMPDRDALGILVQDSTHVTLQGNTVRERITAIGVRDAPGTQVLGNTVGSVSDDLGGGHGILILSDDVIVRDNALSLGGEAFFLSRGIQVDGLGVTVEGNHLEGPFNPSVLLSGDALGDVSQGLAGFGSDNVAEGKTLLVIRNRAHESFDFDDADATPLAVVDSEDVELRNADADHHPFYIYESKEVRVLGGVFGGLERLGGGNDGAIGIAKSESVTLQDCRLLRGTNEGVQISRSSYVTVQGCTFRGEDLPASKLFHGHVGFRAISCILSDHITIRDNLIQDWAQTGVDLGACSDVAITGNLFTEKRTTDVYQIPFQHHPLSILTAAVSMRVSRDVLIAENRVPGLLSEPDAYASNGFLVVNSLGVTIRDNALEDLDGTGIILFGGETTLHGNRVERVAEAGIQIGSGARADLHRNQISGNAIGIDIPSPSGNSPPTDTVLMRHNNVEGNAVGLRSAPTQSPVDARLNWWGSPSGPSGASSGTGDLVLELPWADVRVDPWLEEPAST